MMFPKKRQHDGKKQAPSILQGGKYCYLTYYLAGVKCSIGLEQHHIYMGNRNRAVSDENGFWVWLRPEYHRTTNTAVHGRDGAFFDHLLKQECQRAYEARGGTREEFIRLIGRNYLP